MIEGKTGLTLKVGGNFITIDPSGVQISGMPSVLINSGGAALPSSPGNLTLPQTPAVADNADDAKPGSKTKLERASEARKEKRRKENKNKNPG